MNDAPLLFREPIEVQTRRRFKPDCEISIENFVKIIGQTVFKKEDWVSCQVRRPDKRMCGKHFGNGWVALNKDGDEGYIGCDCADRDFKASETYALEKRRVEAHFELLKYIEVLEERLRDRPAFERRVSDLASRAEDTHHRAEGIRDTLPRRIVEALQDRFKRSNNRISVEYEYVETQDDGSKKYSWVGQPVGVIRGLAVIDFKTTLTPKVNTQRLTRCLSEVRIDQSAGKDNLQRWSETLGTLERVEVEVQTAEAALKAFTDAENLKRLLLLTQSPPIREQMALLILRREGNRSATSDDARELVSTFDDGVRAANGGRNFRIR